MISGGTIASTHPHLVVSDLPYFVISARYHPSLAVERGGSWQRMLVSQPPARKVGWEFKGIHPHIVVGVDGICAIDDAPRGIDLVRPRVRSELRAGDKAEASRLE